MGALRRFWARSLINKAIVILVVIFCCCPLPFVGRGGNRAAQTGAAASTAAAEAPRSTEAATEAPAAPTAAPEATETPEGYISRAELGEDWPLTVDDGVLKCDDASRVTFTTGGVIYAVNGTAAGFADRFGWKSINDLSVPDPNYAGLIKDMRPLINRGLALCK